MRPRSVIVVLVLAAVLGGGIGVALALLRSGNGTASPGVTSPLLTNTSLDPGETLSGRAPAFTLTDQFGRAVSLRSFRGKVVLLSFDDPVCTTICPLTTTAMVEAKQLLGPAGAQVQLLGVAANPETTQVKWVRDYSRLHGLLHQWYFLTAPLPRLKQVWNDYGIAAQVIKGAIDHTPALYVIDRHGGLRKLYVTQMAYAGVDQQALILAREIARLLPGHPAVRAKVSYAQATTRTPRQTVAVARAGGGRVTLGPGAPRLYLFFATWVSETTDLRAQLGRLDAYQAYARAHGLPQLTAVDEGSVEPSPQALPRFLARLPRPLSYPVAVDAKGSVADGYRVQDQPWLVLVSKTGRFLWYHDVSAAGWPSTSALVAKVRKALARGAQQHGAGAQ